MPTILSAGVRPYHMRQRISINILYGIDGMYRFILSHIHTGMPCKFRTESTKLPFKLIIKLDTNQYENDTNGPMDIDCSWKSGIDERNSQAGIDNRNGDSVKNLIYTV